MDNSYENQIISFQKQIILILATSTAIFLIVALCSISSHIPFCVNLARNITNCIFVNPEDSHLDFDPEDQGQILKYQYREDIQCSNKLTSSTSQLTLSRVNPGQEEGSRPHYVPIPASESHKHRAGAVLTSPTGGPVAITSSSHY